MQSVKRAFIYGFLLWLLPFVISIAVFPLKKPEPVLFQSLMVVLSVFLVIIFSVHYFQKIKGNLKEGIFLGVIFLLISLFFDFFFFIRGPIKMSVLSYVKEIGITYLVYPIITIGFGFVLGRTKSA